MTFLLSVSLLSACNQVPDDVQSVIDRQNNYAQGQFELCGIDEIISQTKELGGTSFNQFILPKTIYVDENARFYTFQASHSDTKPYDFDTFSALVTGSDNFSDEYVKLSAGNYQKINDDNIIYIELDKSIGYFVGNIESVPMQIAEQNAENKETFSVFGQDDFQYDKAYYDSVLENIVLSLNSPYEYKLSEHTQIECDGAKIDYFIVDITYNGIALNRYIFPKSNMYSDCVKNTYLADLNARNIISFIDKDNIGAFRILTLTPPADVCEYDKICSLKSALSMLSQKLADGITIEFSKIELVYIGQTDDFGVDDYGQFILTSPDTAMNYRPYWAFTTTYKDACGASCNGKSCFIVDALSGEVSTFTDLSGE